MIPRVEMKQRAKEAMQKATVHPVLMSLIYLGIITGMSVIFTIVVNIVVSLLVAPMAYSLHSGHIATAIGTALVIYAMVFVAVLVICFIQLIISLGFTDYSLKVIRNEMTSVGDLFFYFRKIGKVFCLYFMMSLFITLWSLLFYVPGIIAAIRYSMAPYIFIDDPSKPVMQCIRESKQMMDGHKGEYFVLQLSFILWILGVSATCGILGVYVTPYMNCVNAIYYDNLTYVTGMHNHVPKHNQWNDFSNMQPQNNQWNNGAPQQPQNDQWNNGAPQQPQNDPWNNNQQ